MSATLLHPEDIKAELRKRHGTIGAFATARGLKPQSLVDWLRGRTSAPVARVVADELGMAEVHVSSPQSMKVDDSNAGPGTHRLNAKGR